MQPPDHRLNLMEPSEAKLVIDVFLAQAETLLRLGRAEDFERKLSVAREIALKCFESNNESASAMLISARVAMAGGHLDFAAKLLSAARKLKGDETTMHNIAYQENMLTREREIAGGDLIAMAQHLIVYSCQSCGRLVEYISVPCLCCGWRPTTLVETSQSG